jgi:hypothetical protein
MKPGPILLFFLCMTVGGAFFAQEKRAPSLPKETGVPSTVKKKKKIKLHVTYDSLFIKDYDNLLSVTLPFSSSYLMVDLTDKTSKSVLNFRPKQDLNVGLGLGYQWLGLSYSVAPGALNPTDKTRGTTRYNDYSFSFSGRRFILDLYFEQYQGFFINNYASFPKQSKADTSLLFPQRPDMKAISAGLSFYYLQNYTRFSYKAAFGCSEEQLKGAGTFLYGGYISTFNMSADSGLVSGKYKKYLGGYCNMDHSNSLNIGMAVGYMYTFVIKKHFYATISINPGLSYLNYQAHAYGPKDTVQGHRDSTYIVKSQSNLGFRLQSRIALGYNSPRWYAGLNFAGDAFYQNESVARSSLDYSIGSFRIFVGYRFNVPLLNRIWPTMFHTDNHINLEGNSGS